MKLSIDESVYFDNVQLHISGIKRRSIEFEIAGLNGKASFDMGTETRKIVQSGTLRAENRRTIDERIALITLLIDGYEHILQSSDGKTFEHCRIDNFEPGPITIGNDGARCEYRIEYTQLRIS